MKRSIFLLSIATLLGAALTAQAGELTVGNAAPPLKVAKWIKGQPVKSFEKGKVYVVEFWATWCGPCKASIPHLTEMAKKYKGKATFTGVSVWENPPGQWKDTTLESVAKFVKDMGEKMDYNIAADGQEAFMAENWMQAASQGGIPTAFVVDRDGTIAWIGHPMVGLDEAVGQIIDGKFDKAAFKVEFAKAQEEQKKAMEANEKLSKMLGPFQDAMKAGKKEDAIKEIDKIIAADSEIGLQLATTKFMLLASFDEAGAMAWAAQALDGLCKDDAMNLNTIAWTMIDTPEIKKPDYQLAIKMAVRANELTNNENPMILDTLGYAYFKSGNLDKAIEIQEKAVASLANTQIDDKTKKEIQDRLTMFKEKKKGG
jgi:thiol-disulfide isomerase/thioredoxin